MAGWVVKRRSFLLGSTCNYTLVMDKEHVSLVSYQARVFSITALPYPSLPFLVALVEIWIQFKFKLNKYVDLNKN